MALTVCDAQTIPPDKIKHMEAGSLIGVSMGVYSQNPLLGVGMACAAGAAKEFYDYATYPRHDPEMADFVFTCAAGLVASYTLSGFRMGISGDAPVVGISMEW